ncbi:MAG TPA: ribosomal protein S18-alanine N-acetyltransferase [Burkholderiales bacterium]|nr:ribosomal protein S18-alanine N-acetyltransferase [Burkholderiales bacterium]
MSAVLDRASAPRPRLARMQPEDLDAVVAVESAIYSHPWTRGNFVDALRAEYECWVWREADALIGYFVLLVAAGEAHLLNFSVAADHPRRGCGSAMLDQVIAQARQMHARSVFLEVRPSNAGAQRLYQRFGFRRVAVRRGYYPAHSGREDALVYVLRLA